MTQTTNISEQIVDTIYKNRDGKRIDYFELGDFSRDGKWMVAEYTVERMSSAAVGIIKKSITEVTGAAAFVNDRTGVVGFLADAQTDQRKNTSYTGSTGDDYEDRKNNSSDIWDECGL